MLAPTVRNRIILTERSFLRLSFNADKSQSSYFEETHYCFCFAKCEFNQPADQQQRPAKREPSQPENKPSTLSHMGGASVNLQSLSMFFSPPVFLSIASHARSIARAPAARTKHQNRLVNHRSRKMSCELEKVNRHCAPTTLATARTSASLAVDL